ncbi:MAG: hypothetical protein GY854_20510 [Deltaproteobacteria bacterium]|nr:hypothetical protein [Deltaproteobacteria bacterium]
MTRKNTLIYHFLLLTQLDIRPPSGRLSHEPGKTLEPLLVAADLSACPDIFSVPCDTAHDETHTGNFPCSKHDHDNTDGT